MTLSQIVESYIATILFYRSLDSVNKVVDDQLVTGGIIQQPNEVVSQLFDGMTYINMELHNHEYQVFPLTFRMKKEHIEKYE